MGVTSWLSIAYRSTPSIPETRINDAELTLTLHEAVALIELGDNTANKLGDAVIDNKQAPPKSAPTEKEKSADSIVGEILERRDPWGSELRDREFMRLVITDAYACGVRDGEPGRPS